MPYDKNGDWVKSWGQKGAKEGEFDTPHSAEILNWRVQKLTLK
jgi:hypothetical protein